MKTSTINTNLQVVDDDSTVDPSGNITSARSISRDVEPRIIKKDVIKVKKDEIIGMRKRVVIAVLSAVVLLVISGLVYQFKFVNSDLLNPVSNGSEKKSTDGLTGVSDRFESPVNGAYFSKEDAAKFKDRKPIAVMVNNYVVARPSAGLSKADIIYEAVAEAGITRLMPIFYSRIPESVGSIRSARYYFVQLASAYSAHYIHWGAAYVPACQKESSSSSKYCPPVGGKVETNPAVDAYDWIVKLGVPNLDGGNYACEGDKCAFGRDPMKVGKIPLEHTAFVRLPLIFDLAKDIRPQESWHKYVNVAEWKFKDDALDDDRGDIGLTVPITYNYWDTMPGFNVKWVYNKEKNEYTRYQGDVKQIDAFDGVDLRAKVIVVRFTKEESVGDKKGHLYYEITGTGNALIFQDGKVIKGTWTRENPDVRDIYKNLEGNQIELVRGQIWIQLVPMKNIVSYGQVEEITVN